MRHTILNDVTEAQCKINNYKLTLISNKLKGAKTEIKDIKIKIDELIDLQNRLLAQLRSDYHGIRGSVNAIQ